ncbi:MAG TPA: LmeA family phospholipid-binding protein [Intrasporangiaceae bacterium]|nr:LmeA family phospholipid-binding protein [Intrasporangiaceae bacterium]
MRWRPFALGCIAGLLVAALGGMLLFIAITSPAGTPPPGRTSAPGFTPGPSAPATVAPGETWLGDVDLSSSSVLTSDGPLRNVEATGAGVTLTADGLQAGRLQIEATLPFGSAAEQIGDDIELYAAGTLAGMRRTVEILGREVTIEATGIVRADRGQLVIEPQMIDLGSFAWIDSVASAAVRAFVTIRHTVTGIPEGLRLDEVEVRGDGFRVDLSGRNVRIG